MQKPRHTASHICGCILRHRPPGNWHTDGVPTAAPANARWRSWASIASVQASSTIEYLSSDNIGQGVFLNTIVSMKLFANSKVAFWCWETIWSALALGCATFWSPLVTCSDSAWVDCARSDSDNFWRRVDFWCLSRGGSNAQAGFREFGSRGHSITVSTRLRFCGSGILVVCNGLSQPA